MIVRVLALLLFGALTLPACAIGQTVILSTKEQQALKALMGTSGEIEQLIIRETGSQPVLSTAGHARMMADSVSHTLLCSFNGNPYTACSGGGGGGTINGSITASQVAFGVGVDTIGGTANFTYSNPTSTLALTRTVVDGSSLSMVSSISGSKNNDAGATFMLGTIPIRVPGLYMSFTDESTYTDGSRTIDTMPAVIPLNITHTLASAFRGDAGVIGAALFAENAPYDFHQEHAAVSAAVSIDVTTSTGTEPNAFIPGGTAPSKLWFWGHQTFMLRADTTSGFPNMVGHPITLYNLKAGNPSNTFGVTVGCPFEQCGTAFSAAGQTSTDDDAWAQGGFAMVDNDSTRTFQVDSSGAVSINVLRTSAGFPLTILGKNAASIQVTQTAANASGAPVSNTYAFRKNQGTAASPLAILSGDVLGVVSGGGYTGSGFVDGKAFWHMSATQNWSGGATGAGHAWWTTADGSTTAALAMSLIDKQLLVSNAITAAGLHTGLGAAVTSLDVYSKTPLVSNTHGAAFLQYGNDASGPNLIIWKGRGSPSVPAAVQSGDTIGTLSWAGNDGVNPWATSVANWGATIGVVSEGLWSGSQTPASMRILTTPASSRSLTEAVWITATQRVLLSGGSSSAGFPTANTLEVHSVSGTNNRGAAVKQYSGDATGPVLNLFKSRGSPGTPALVQSADALGVIAFRGYDGTTNWSTSMNGFGATIASLATENWDASGHGGELRFSTVPNNSTTLTEAMLIGQDQHVEMAGKVTTGQSVLAITTTDIYSVGGTNTRGAAVLQYSADATGPTMALWKSRGTRGSPALVQSGDVLGQYAFQGYDGTNAWSTSNSSFGATIAALATENWDNTGHGAEIRMFVVANNATSLTQALIIAQNTNATFAGSVTATGGFVGALTGNVTGNVTGNASTATALAANPTDCAANEFANAIAASGNLTCAALVNSIAGTAAQITLSAAQGAVTASLPAFVRVAAGGSGRLSVGNGVADTGVDATINTSTYYSGGLAGFTGNLTVRDAGGAADCNITVSGGIILTSGTTC